MVRMLGRNRIRPPGGTRDDPWFTDPAGARRRQRHRESQLLPAVIAEQLDDEVEARLAAVLERHRKGG